MARTSLSQRVVVNINMMEYRRKTRKPRKKQTQIQLTRQSGLRMIPTMYPVYINPSVSQNPLASYAGTHQVDADIRLRPSQFEHPGLTTRQPVMPDPEVVTDAMAVASHVQTQTPGKPSSKPFDVPDPRIGTHRRTGIYRSPGRPQIFSYNGVEYVKNPDGTWRRYTGKGVDTPSS